MRIKSTKGLQMFCRIQGQFCSHILSAAIVASLAVSAPAFAGRAELSGLQPGHRYDQFIIKYKANAVERTNADKRQESLNRAANAVSKSKGIALRLRHKRSMSLGADVLQTDRPIDRVEAESLLRQLASDPNVEYAEADARMHHTLTPNDTRYSEQWGYTDTDAGIKANEAWDLSSGTGVVVAVIDTGITPHSDLNANILPGYDFITSTFTSRDGDGRDANPNDEGDWSPTANECYSGSRITNSSWHGTHVAGTVAAVTSNAKGVAGTAFGAKVVPVRVLGRCGGNLSDIADAITWASGGSVSGVPANANPAEVINMSLGGGGACGSTYQNAINGAIARGTTVVVAAGNNNSDSASFQPASCSGVIAVAAVDSNGARSVWSITDKSNYGSIVDVAAPGSNIISTLNTGTTTQGSETYASYGGTSMAAPHVAGVVALIQAASPAPKTPSQIESLIKEKASAFPATPDQYIGTGIVNAKAVVAAVASVSPGTIRGLGGKCLDAQGGGTANGTPINVWSCNGFAQQSWSVTSTGGIKGTPSNRLLDAISFGTTDGTQLQLWDATGSTNQAWHFTNTKIVGIGGKVLDAVDGSSSNGTEIQLWSDLGNPQQKWNFRPETGEIIGNSGKCLDVAGGSTTNGTPVQLWECSGVAQQKWQPGPGGTFRGIGGKCLEAANGGSANGTRIRIWDCNGGTHQSWRLVGEIRGVMSGKCLDDPNSGNVDGSRVHLWTCHGGSNQQWEYSSD